MSRSDQTSLSREDELRHTDSPMAWLALYIRNTNSPALERALALMGTKPAARSSKSKWWRQRGARTPGRSASLRARSRAKFRWMSPPTKFARRALERGTAMDSAHTLRTGLVVSLPCAVLSHARLDERVTIKNRPHHQIDQLILGRVNEGCGASLKAPRKSGRLEAVRLCASRH